MSFALIVPTYNSGKSWADSIQAIKSQTLAPDDVLIIGTSSYDSTVAESAKVGLMWK